MGYYVERLKRPYDFRVLIEAYIYTRRRNFIHEDFGAYYGGLLQALQPFFGLTFPPANVDIARRVFWNHFDSTVSSLLQIAHPRDGYLEDSLLNFKLQDAGELGQRVFQIEGEIGRANVASAAAHREMLYTLFEAIFGTRDRLVTSEELAAAGFDDSREPNSSDYYDFM
jgi:hypothetical protein